MTQAKPQNTDATLQKPKDEQERVAQEIQMIQQIEK